VGGGRGFAVVPRRCCLLPGCPARPPATVCAGRSGDRRVERLRGGAARITTAWCKGAPNSRHRGGWLEGLVDIGRKRFDPGSDKCAVSSLLLRHFAMVEQAEDTCRSLHGPRGQRGQTETLRLVPTAIPGPSRQA